MRSHLLFIAVLATSASFAGAENEIFQDDDLVVLLGGTLIERAQEYGHWEAAIQLATPDKTLRFRNFGWSADTVWAESRGQFDKASKGYERLIEQVTAIKPDVIVFGYGSAEALDGSERSEQFVRQYKKLVRDLGVVRKVFLKPVIPCQECGPWAAAQKRDGLRKGVKSTKLSRVDTAFRNFSEAVAAVAADFTAPVIDLNEQLGYPGQGGRQNYFEPNGIHLSRVGYQVTAKSFANSSSTGDIFDSPSEDLLSAIVAKNRLVFYRWRPQNITYLALFRKHEQGNNYAEIPLFDPLIDKADAEIDRIKRRVATTEKLHQEGSKAEN